MRKEKEQKWNFYQKGSQRRIENVISFFYPGRCPVCDGLLPFRGRDYVCEQCRNSLVWIRQPHCMKCGKPVKNASQEYCEDCRKNRHEFDSGAACFVYEGEITNSIWRMKYRQRKEYLAFYAHCIQWLAGWYFPRWKPEILVPVPMHWKRKNRRGYNQSEILTDLLSKKTKLPVIKLKKQKDTKMQKELSAGERKKNLRGAFSMKPLTRQVRCAVIIDDVYTTGSTMDEISRLLRKNGIKEIHFLVLCCGKG